MLKLIFMCFCFVLSNVSFAEDAAIAQLFRNFGVDGTLVIESVGGGQRFVHDDIRAQQEFTVASTFKVPNTLIALDEGVVSGINTVFHWDGTQYEIEAWNHDQTLKSAFSVSCVWCYQQIAQSVGGLKYLRYLQQLNYGHLHQPFNETDFWLDGSLTASADQQVAFLRQITGRKLPFKPSSYDALKAIMLLEESPQYRLYAKTGWAARVSPAIGWFIGYVETRGDVWLFALNLTIRDNNDLPLRLQIAKQALKLKGILPTT